MGVLQTMLLLRRGVLLLLIFFYIVQNKMGEKHPTEFNQVISSTKKC